ncbi:MAG TPA: hypothetical protein DCM28_23135 [Phycisphaerales bacterium]|nr:hypothetical protein [Phycisphaerales bacterium]
MRLYLRTLKYISSIIHGIDKVSQNRNGACPLIGLSIVKEIINAHEGRVWLESQAGKGSTFYFSLPTASVV